MKPLKFLINSLIASLALSAAGSAFAQAYPNKPVKVVVSFAAGASIDILARVVLDDIAKRTGTLFIVEHKPGALGAIGMEAVAKAAPDGYTVMPSSSATHSSGPQLSKLPMPDALKAFTHLGAIDRFDLMLVVNAQSGITTVEQLVAEAKKRRTTYGYGSATGQVGASAFTRAVGVEADGVPYKSQPLALTDVMGGHVLFATSDLPSVSPHIKSGKLKALAVSSDKRSSLFPDVPTLTERGIKVELVGWVGFAGPAGLSEEVRSWWARNISIALANPAVIEQYRTMGIEPFSMSGPAYTQFVQQQFDVWGRHIREAGIKPE